jgi:hypothetical protein
VRDRTLTETSDGPPATDTQAALMVTGAVSRPRAWTPTHSPDDGPPQPEHGASPNINLLPLRLLLLLLLFLLLLLLLLLLPFLFLLLSLYFWQGYRSAAYDIA